MALFVRKSSADEWAAFPILLVLGIPCVLLYGLGTGHIRLGRDDVTGAETGVPGWRSAATVLGLILLPLTLLQLVDTLGGDPNKSGHVAWVFLVTAGAGFAAALLHGVRWGALFGGVSLIFSWVAFWDAVADPSGTAMRWLFLIVAALLVVGAVRLGRDSRREADELVTAGGIAALLAGVIGLFSLAGQLVAGAFASALGSESDLSGVQQRQEWDAFLLLLALALIWYGLRAAWRGPVYVGALALFTFILSVGIEITSFFSGDGPSGDLVGWPLLLLLVGGGALAVGLVGGGGTATPAPADTGWQAGQGGEPGGTAPPAEPPPTEPLPPTQPPPPGPPQP